METKNPTLRTAILLPLLLGASAAHAETILTSANSSGAQARGGGSFESSISADGRYSVFASYANNLVANDGNNTSDIFLRDHVAGTTALISRAPQGSSGNGFSRSPQISPDGRFIVFESFASNLVAGDTNNKGDVFLYDRLNKTLEIVSRRNDGGLGNSTSSDGSVSADGRYVAFKSNASNFIGGDNNATDDIFIRDRLLKTTQCLSLTPSRVTGNGYSYSPRISADGKTVVFTSWASNLVAGDSNNKQDVFVWKAGSPLSVASVNTNGVLGNGESAYPSISANGQYIAFESLASNLVGNDTNGVADIFVRDMANGKTWRFSVNNSGVQGNGSSNRPAISADGKYVAFSTRATNFGNRDANNENDIYLSSIGVKSTPQIRLISVMLGDVGTATGDHESLLPSISADGRYVSFASAATSLVAFDANGLEDVFRRDTQGLSMFGGEGTAESADIGVSQTQTALSLGNEPLTFTVKVQNHGPDGTAVSLFDHVPSDAQRLSIRPSQGTCTLGTSFACRLGNIASGRSATVYVSYKPGLSRQDYNAVFARGLLEDFNMDNNSSYIESGQYDQPLHPMFH